MLPSAASDVTAGENSGETLRHTNVVLSLKHAELSRAGTAQTQFELPGSFRDDWSRLQVVSFVQERRTGRVVGAAAWRPEQDR